MKPTNAPEASEREPALATEVRLGSAGYSRDVPVPAVGCIGVLGLTGVLGNGRSALYTRCQRVCDWSL
jgi:hypothetical protein